MQTSVHELRVLDCAGTYHTMNVIKKKALNRRSRRSLEKFWNDGEIEGLRLAMQKVAALATTSSCLLEQILKTSST